MKKLSLYLCIILSLNSIVLQGQETQLIQKSNGAFYEEYQALKSDTSVRNGRYFRKYKNDLIEQGTYIQGNKCGRWAYFSFEGIFEFEFDYNTYKVVKIAGKQLPEDYLETPVFFLGSPIIPYLHMARNIRYPNEAKEHDINGKITLAMKINKNGHILSLHLKKKLHPLLDKEVIKVAKTFPNKWEWIPATYHGQNIDSEYQIDIEFELVSDSLD